MAPGAPPRPTRVLLFLAAAFAVLAACSPRDLWSPDEPRYGLVARHMEASGDWLVPRVNGLPYPEKPPAAFWAMAAVGAVGGEVTALAARLGCALLAAAAVLTLARLARRWFEDPALGDTAGILFATTGLVLWNSSRAALDLPMTLCSLLALEAGTVVVTRRSLAAAIGFGAALGFGVLVKGPHALYLPVFGLIGGCVASGQVRRLLDPRWLAGFATLGLVVAAWLLPALRAAGDETTASGLTYRERLLGQIASRVSDENEPHSHDVWFFLPVLLGAGLPWTSAWLVGCRVGLRARGEPETVRFGLGAAFGGIVLSLVALSIPGSKRELYLIPALAMTAVLAAYALRYRTADPTVRATPQFAAAILVGAALLLGLAPFVRWTGLAPEGPVRGTFEALSGGAARVACLGAAALSGLAAARVLRARRESERATLVAATGLGVVWVVLALGVLPAFDGNKSWRGAAAVAARERPGAPLYEAGFTDPSVLWWFRRDRVGLLGNAAYAETAGVLAPDAPPAVVIVKGKFWAERARRARPEDRAILDRAVVLWRDEIGGGEQLLLSNAPAR